MKNKSERLLAIRRMIGNTKISSQEELLKLLIADGFNMTQATLSRDLKLLKVAKIPDNDKGYIYMLQENGPSVNSEMQTGFPPNAFLAMEFAQGMGLIKTLPGFAAGIASAIDSFRLWEVAGTIAGDDTILLIPRDGVKKNEVISQLLKHFPLLKSKLA
jgi:transcriptional regulator of arginine metabolism